MKRGTQSTGITKMARDRPLVVLLRLAGLCALGISSAAGAHLRLLSQRYRHTHRPCTCTFQSTALGQQQAELAQRLR